MNNASRTVSRRVYCQQFQTLLNRVRSAAKLQKKQKERISVLAETNKARFFPLPGTIGIAASLEPSDKVEEKLTNFFQPFFRFGKLLRFSAERSLEIQFAASKFDRDDRFFYGMTNAAKAEEKVLPPSKPRPLGVRVASDKVECLLQECSPKLRKNFAELFPAGIPSKVSGSKSDRLSALIISHHTEHDMSVWSTEMDVERENLTDQFVKMAMEICETLKENGVWADFIDPSSGRPFYSPYTNATFFDTDDRYKEFGFMVEDLGCCKCLEHPVWGVKAFVGCILTNAPPTHPILTEIIQSKTE